MSRRFLYDGPHAHVPADFGIGLDLVAKVSERLLHPRAFPGAGPAHAIGRGSGQVLEDFCDIVIFPGESSPASPVKSAQDAEEWHITIRDVYRQLHPGTSLKFWSAGPESNGRLPAGRRPLSRPFKAR